MPVYFFESVDGTHLEVGDGLEYPDLRTATHEAARAAIGLMSDAAQAGVIERVTVIIRDHSGIELARTIASVTIDVPGGWKAV